MAVNYAPKSLRFDEITEDRLKAWNQLTGEPVSEAIRRFVIEGLDRESTPEALQARVDAYTQRVAAVSKTLSRKE